jgi:signal transduction histidine kinase
MDEAPADARDRVERSIEALQSAIGDIRDFIYELRPAPMSADDLRDALRGLGDEVARNGTTAVSVEVVGEGMVPPELASELVVIAREALSNVGRHARADRAAVRLVVDDDLARLTISDDGHGFDIDAPRDARHQGLGNMRERAEARRGRLVVSSTPGSGTQVEAVIPRHTAGGAA